jgi:hypothetical protein
MKKIVLLGVLLLASCIDVGDFGAYWDKGSIDPNLTGEWVAVPDAQRAGDNVEFRITDDNGVYKIVENDNGKENTYQARTLEVGSYSFLMVLDGEQRRFVRYQETDDGVTLYVLKDEPAWAFIKQRVPSPKIFSLEHGMLGPILKIKMLNDDVVKLLGAIPDNDEYWEQGATLTRKTTRRWRFF